MERQAWLVARKSLMTLIMSVLAILMITPFLWMISASLKGPSEVFQFPIQWIPMNPKFHNYRDLWLDEYNPFYLYYWNSIKVTVLSLVVKLIVSSLAAYAFARIEFKGRELLFLVYLSTMMIPPHVTLVPKFVLFHSLGLYNTHWALIIPSGFSIIGIFLLRQFFMTIPKELSEAALIDGAGHFTIYWRMLLPLSTSALVSLTILTFVSSWNDYLNPLIFLTSKSLYTIPLGLQSFLSLDIVEYNKLMAGAALAV
ncbi:MAG: transporter, permease protein [Paenibacillus sp.]|nr:transporter, permease protein [Paenibacillus sp.]